jgi:hypothetical protein
MSAFSFCRIGSTQEAKPMPELFLLAKTVTYCSRSRRGQVGVIFFAPPQIPKRRNPGIFWELRSATDFCHLSQGDPVVQWQMQLNAFLADLD